MLRDRDSRLPVWRSQVDRDAPLRIRDDALDILLADEATRVLAVRRGSALSQGMSLALVPLSELPEGAIQSADAVVYLGRSLDEGAPEPVGTPVIAVAVSEPVAQKLETPGRTWINLRALGGDASKRDTELLSQAFAVINWHASHGFSPRTGAATVPVSAGWVRKGIDPEHEIFPRIDPSVIVAVLDADDRILLGSNAMWEANRFSLLAGFVEPGESLEAAVEREILEESGIFVTDAHYLGSQSWPMPASLMLGFSARVDPERESLLRPDGEEILELRWFSREELRDSLDTILLPGRASIARSILEWWFGEPIPEGQATGIPR
ncbi:NAD(+) diphosphatase [Homoserinimonas hongtaonis]|uniref:NAD(+) diphosphatase n=1 Tax=Homoserinimonas hongtaonis TaxID=2079791 RepID=A0A2U1SWY9_9MICO|nr:NAD(+) diphosphatase [Salinibacterium hongtaonis]PWB96119.1 NAD(+) diphosphatase [Salinibacterium hongtaonis]